MLNTTNHQGKKNLKSVGKDVDHLEPLCMAGMNENSAAVWKTVLQFLKT